MTFLVSVTAGNHQAEHCTLWQSVDSIVMTFDGRLSRLLKCSALLRKIASLSVRSVLPSALSNGMVPELFGPLTVFIMHHASWNFFISFPSSKDWIYSAFLLSQTSCMSLNLSWTVLQILLQAAFFDTELVSF